MGIEKLKKQKNKIKSLEQQIQTERAQNQYQFDLIQKQFQRKMQDLQKNLEAEQAKNESIKSQYDEKEDDQKKQLFEEQLKYLESEQNLDYYKEIQIGIDHEIAIKEHQKEQQHQRKMEEDAEIARRLQQKLKKEKEIEKEQDDFEYLDQLNQIKNIMALQDEERDDAIKQILVEHKGDISSVVPLLLQ